jgi:hypothetical protein
LYGLFHPLHLNIKTNYMKRILLLAVLPCIALQLAAQSSSKKVPPPPPPPKVATPPPPPPGHPPPPPPPGKTVKQVRFTPPVIVNSKGYAMSVRRINGVENVQVKKGKMSKLVKLSDWNARQTYYENLYGELPPPPPPPPVKQ